MSFRDAFRLVHAIPRATRTCDGAHTYLPGPVAVTLLYRPKREILPLLYRATRSHTRVAGNDIAVPSSNTICPPPSPSLSSSSFLPRTSRSKEAKVEANHHAITAPGAANSDPFRERQQPPFAAPGHSLPLYRCIAKPTIFILDSAEKKASLSPPSTLFSASFLQITGGPTDRSRLLASGESIARMAPIPL